MNLRVRRGAQRLRGLRKSNNHFIETAMVTTRDGTGLATDIHRPMVDGKMVEEALPVLLQRTPYDKGSLARLEEATFFTNRGYVTVIQDCRGRYESEGGFTKYVDEGEDGYDTVEWLGQQSWCNGKIGTFGLSYAAHTQAALASLNPPSLAAMWLECGGFASAYHSGCRNGGAFELRQVTWAFREAMESAEARANPGTTRAAMGRQELREWFKRFPWKRGHSPLSWTPDYEDYLMEIWGHDVFDEYWQQVGLCAMAHYGSFADVPQVHQCSWYDPYAAGTVQNYVELSQSKSSSVYLIMGPWTHGARSATHAGDVDFGPQSTLDNPREGSFNEQRVAFFDRWLKEEENGWDQRAPVKLFVMGGGKGRRNAEGRLEHGGKWVESASADLAAGAGAGDHPVPAGGRRAGAGAAPVGRSAQQVPVRPGQPGADHRREHLVGVAHHGTGGIRPAGIGGVLREPGALPAAWRRARMCWPSRRSRYLKPWRSPGRWWRNFGYHRQRWTRTLPPS